MAAFVYARGMEENMKQGGPTVLRVTVNPKDLVSVPSEWMTTDAELDEYWDTVTKNA